MLMMNCLSTNSMKIMMYCQVSRIRTFHGEINTLKPIPFRTGSRMRSIIVMISGMLDWSSWTNPHALSFKEKKALSIWEFYGTGCTEMLSLKMIKGSRAAAARSFLYFNFPAYRKLFAETPTFGASLDAGPN